jgi:hypothetical protein
VPSLRALYAGRLQAMESKIALMLDGEGLIWMEVFIFDDILIYDKKIFFIYNNGIY